jgi:hypothetical protein
MNTTELPAAPTQLTAASAVSKLVECLKIMTNLAERYGAGADCDGNILEARELIEQCANLSPALTEMEISDWLASSNAELAELFGTNNTAVSVQKVGMNHSPLYAAHAYGECELSSSYQNAVDKLKRRLAKPDEIAAAKREAARKLMAEANALSPEVIA